MIFTYSFTEKFIIELYNSEEKLKDLDFTEIAILFILMFVTILLGIYPNIILEPISSSVDLVVKKYNYYQMKNLIPELVILLNIFLKIKVT